MIEVLASVALITVGVMALLTLLPTGMKLSGSSDMLGRAAAILQAELNMNEILIMNGNNTVNAIPSPGTSRRVFGSRNKNNLQQLGDIQYTVTTQRTRLGSQWLVQVRVTWTGNSNGIAESLIVGPQKYFAQQ